MEPATQPPQRGVAAEHEHAWSTLEFVLEDGHPWVRQACRTCATVRRYRAWERYWDPAAPSPDGPLHPAAQDV